MLQVINNFLNNNEFHSIRQIITSSHFPWYFPESGEKKFIHNLVKKNEEDIKTSFWITPILSPIIRKLEVYGKDIPDKNVISANIVLTHKTKETFESKPIEDVFKIDLNEPSETAKLYLNNNNGYTKIVGGDKVESVQNRLLIFPTNTSHFEATSTNMDYRMVLNVVYKI